MCFRRTDTTVASDNLRDDQFKQRPALVSRGHTPFRPAHGPCHAQHAKEVWPARFRTRNRNEAHTKKNDLQVEQGLCTCGELEEEKPLQSSSRHLLAKEEGCNYHQTT